MQVRLHSLRMGLSMLFLLAAGFLGGCASGPQYPGPMPELAKDQGRIVFYRGTAYFGWLVSSDIRLNSEVVGHAALGSFCWADRPAGDYDVSCTTEAEEKCLVHVTPGQTTYVQTTIQMGLFVGHVVPRVVDSSEALKDLPSLHYAGPPA